MNVVIETAHATFRAEPEYGRPVTFEVRVRTVNVSQHSGWSRNMQSRYVVGLKGSDGAGFAHFMSFEKACQSALSRARRYEKAYSRPRGLQARALAAAS
jgi:hypothetical protein